MLPEPPHYGRELRFDLGIVYHEGFLPRIDVVHQSIFDDHGRIRRAQRPAEAFLGIEAKRTVVFVVEQYAERAEVNCLTQRFRQGAEEFDGVAVRAKNAQNIEQHFGLRVG